MLMLNSCASFVHSTTIRIDRSAITFNRTAEKNLCNDHGPAIHKQPLCSPQGPESQVMCGQPGDVLKTR